MIIHTRLDLYVIKDTIPQRWCYLSYSLTDWLVSQSYCRYMSNFPYPVSSKQVLFEKSATYFANPYAPERMYSLLPKAKLVIILADPIKRAYSWYHVRASTNWIHNTWYVLRQVHNTRSSMCSIFTCIALQPEVHTKWFGCASQRWNRIYFYSSVVMCCSTRPNHFVCTSGCNAM